MTLLGKGVATTACSAIVLACSLGDVMIGDDTVTTLAQTDPDAAVTTDGASSGSDSSSLEDSVLPDASVPDATGDADCPNLSSPVSLFCDGGPIAKIYTSNGCAISYTCAPITCTEGGGQCVALSPGSCASGHVGDATVYLCGGGIGVTCCLP